MKSHGISTINPAIAENTEYLIALACTSFINLNVAVSIDRGVSLHFVSSLALRHYSKQRIT